MLRILLSPLPPPSSRAKQAAMAQAEAEDMAAGDEDGAGGLDTNMLDGENDPPLHGQVGRMMARKLGWGAQTVAHRQWHRA
jgi:hypothetical protein